MSPVSANAPTRHPADPRSPGRSLWIGSDVAAEYDYIEPETLHEAVQAMRSASGVARVIAGGQSLLP